MLFNSIQFIFLFLPIVLIGYSILKSKTKLLLYLALCGYVFYGLFDLRFILLLFLVTVVNYIAGRLLDKEVSIEKNKLILWLAVAFDVGLLIIFEYYNFGLSSAAYLLHLFGIGSMPPYLSIVLPVGISFYTFSAISYIVDIYRKKIEATKSFLEFLTYLSLFPVISAGPIVRYSEISKELESIDKIERTQYLQRGVCFFIIGLAQKVLLADSIAYFINPMLTNYTMLNMIGTWIVIFGYTYQIYFDFCGYSDMAIGLGLILGLKFPQNFNSPFKAANISDFWRRWHISLTRWVNDYVFLSLYTPKITKLRIHINTMISFIILGLWHGANITFAIFGAYHGIMNVGYHISKGKYDRFPETIKRTITLLIVVIGFLIFRSTSLEMIETLLSKLIAFSTIHSMNFSSSEITLCGLILFSFIITNFLKNSNEAIFSQSRRLAVILGLLLLICLLFIVTGTSAFIYYQF